jgi:rhodanese-related sulfurtransferase
MATSVKQMMEAANAAVPRITPAQAREMIVKGNTLVVDVRDAPEVESWQIAPVRQRHFTTAIEDGADRSPALALAAAEPAVSALDSLEHRVEEPDPLLLEIAQHVLCHRRISLPDQDVKAERWQ